MMYIISYRINLALSYELLPVETAESVESVEKVMI